MPDCAPTYPLPSWELMVRADASIHQPHCPKQVSPSPVLSRFLETTKAMGSWLAILTSHKSGSMPSQRAHFVGTRRLLSRCV